MDVWSRRIIGFSVNDGPVDGPTICKMFNQIISRINTPSYISMDHDPLFQFHRWKANLRILEVEEIKSIPFTPISHPYVERIIGTVRREFLDQTLFWNEVDLQNKLNDFIDYYNNHRVHSSLRGAVPTEFGEKKTSKLTNLTGFGWHSLCRGLYQLPIPA
jgi:transposase InsO family protein